MGIVCFNTLLGWEKYQTKQSQEEDGGVVVLHEEGRVVMNAAKGRRKKKKENPLPLQTRESTKFVTN